MEALIERSWAHYGYQVWLFERHPLRVLRFRDGHTAWEEANDHERGDPSLVLPPDALEALLAEAEKVIPASHATERHLTDVIGVRDRLLALIEGRRP